MFPTTKTNGRIARTGLANIEQTMLASPPTITRPDIPRIVPAIVGKVQARGFTPVCQKNPQTPPARPMNGVKTILVQSGTWSPVAVKAPLMRSMTMMTSRAALGSPHQTVRTAPQALWRRGSNKRKIENTIERSTKKAAPPAKAGTRRKKMPGPSPREVAAAAGQREPQRIRRGGRAAEQSQLWRGDKG